MQGQHVGIVDEGQVVIPSIQGLTVGRYFCEKSAAQRRQWTPFEFSPSYGFCCAERPCVIVILLQWQLRGNFWVMGWSAQRLFQAHRYKDTYSPVTLKCTQELVLVTFHTILNETELLLSILCYIFLMHPLFWKWIKVTKAGMKVCNARSQDAKLCFKNVVSRKRQSFTRISTNKITNLVCFLIIFLLEWFGGNLWKSPKMQNLSWSLSTAIYNSVFHLYLQQSLSSLIHTTNMTQHALAQCFSTVLWHDQHLQHYA